MPLLKRLKGGRKGLWAVFSFQSANFKIMAGMKNTTVRRLNIIPFARTRPISKPMLNFMHTRAKKPTTVVRLLAKIELIAASMAFVMASSLFKPFCRSLVNASSRKIE